MTAELVALLAQRRPDVLVLAIPLSLAVRIDLPLARAMRARVAPAADVSLETDLWSSPLVQVRGAGECTLRAAAAAALWPRLPETSEALSAIWSVYAACHAAAPPLIRLEERLAYLARLAALALPDDDGRPAVDAIDRALRSVIAAMTDDERRRRDLASWSARALARLPALVRDTEGARILGAVAAQWVAAPAEVAALAPSLEGAGLARSLAPASARPRRTIAILRAGAVIDVALEARPPPWATLAIAASPLALYVDDDREVPLRRDGVTSIPIVDRDVVLGDGDGQRWLIPARRRPPALDGIAVLVGPAGPGYTYLVEPTLAATSARLLGDAAWIGELLFARDKSAARVVSFDADADCALLQLERAPEVAPLTLSNHVSVNDLWSAFSPGGGPFGRTAARFERPDSRGRVAAVWPDLRLESESPRTLAPGLPIFLGDLVIGHTTSSGELGICPARTVAWWLAQRAIEGDPRRSIVRLRVRTPPSALWRDQLGLVVTPTFVVTPLTAPDELAEILVAPGTSIGASRVFVVDGISGFSIAQPLDRAPCVVGSDQLHDGAPVRIMGDTTTRDGYVFRASPRAAVELDAQAGSPLDNVGRGSAVVVGATVVALLGDTSRTEQVIRADIAVLTQNVLDAIRRHTASYRERHATVISSSPIAPNGLMSTRVAAEGLTVGRTYHTMGPRPWAVELTTSSEHVRRGMFATIAIDVDPRSGASTLRILMGSGREQLRVAAEAASLTLREYASIGFGAPPGRLQITPVSIPGLPHDHQLRRGLRLVLETLAQVDRIRGGVTLERSSSLIHVAIPGCGRLDIATLDAWFSAFSGCDARVVEIDAEVDLVAVVTDDPGALIPALQQQNVYPIAGVFAGADRADTLHSRFGVVAARRGRRLEVIARGDDAELRVTSVNDRPLRGYVAFWVPPAVAASPIRVRATEGVARCRISRSVAHPFTVGAVIEEEGLPLEALVTTSDRGVTLVAVRSLQTRGEAVWDCAVHPDGRRLVVASGDLRLMELESEQYFLRFTGHEGIVFGCAITPDGAGAVSASADHTVRVWNLQTRRPVLRYDGHTDQVCACAVTPDGTRVVSVGEDRTVQVWDLATGRPQLVLEGHTGRICDCVISLDNRRVVTASADATLRVWDLEAGRLIHVLEGHTARVNACAIAPDGRRLVSASYDRTLKLWEPESGRMLATLEGHADLVQTCKISPNGCWIVSGCDDGSLRLWELETGRLLLLVEAAHSGSVFGCAWTPDGARLISVGGDGAVKVWHFDERALSGRFA